MRQQLARASDLCQRRDLLFVLEEEIGGPLPCL
jgi:hypothetical protein